MRRFKKIIMKTEFYSLTLAALLGQLTSGLGQITISKQPIDLSASPGADAAFQLTASGTAPLFYQWRFNGMDLTGATNRNLILSNIQLSNAGDYIAVVSNSSGSITNSSKTSS